MIIIAVRFITRLFLMIHLKNVLVINQYFVYFKFQASYLMDFTKKQALEYWNYWHLKDRNVILGENHKSLASDKKPTLLDQVEHTSKDEEKKQVPSQVPLVDVSESSSSKDLKESETISVKTAEASSFTTSSSSLDDGKNTIKKDSPKKIVDIIHIKDGDSCPDLKVDDNKISDIKDTTDLDIDKFKNYVSGKKPADDQTKPNEETENKPVEDIRPTPQFDGKKRRAYHLLRDFSNTFL